MTRWESLHWVESRATAIATLLLLLGVTIVAEVGCGGGSKPASATGLLEGNWQITLIPHGSTLQPVYTGFLLQKGPNVSGSVILGDGCSGVGTVTGKFDGQNVTLGIQEFGQDISLNGSMPSGSASLSGQYSTLAGACGGNSTGTWTAVQVKPLAGAFHGTFTSLNATLTVTGTLTQGANIGASTATVSGNITATGTVICSYLTSASIRGVISGTVLNVDFYDSKGNIIGQIPTTAQPALLTPDGTSLSGSYSFGAISGSCFGDNGSVQLSFP